MRAAARTSSAAGSAARAGASAVGSVLDFFRIGLGPSSSHTMGPMRAARTFCVELREAGLLGRTATVRASLHGSLAATGIGHGADKAVVLGLSGREPESADPAEVPALLEAVRTRGVLALLGEREVPFSMKGSIAMYRRPLAAHPNGMVFEAFDGDGAVLRRDESYSVGGGFVVRAADAAAAGAAAEDGAAAPYPFSTAAELLEACAGAGLSFSQVMLANEEALGNGPGKVRAYLLGVWRAMSDCIDAGCANGGVLPGGLGVRRRAPALAARLRAADPGDPLCALDRVSLYALAVNEENAAGGRVVTAPTNGAAGVVPAVLRYFVDRCAPRRGRSMDDEVVSFLLAAGAVCSLFKRNASISGAEVGCQGEIGSACAMAAAGLAEVGAGTPAQVENAAEIGLEHNLGLTCDPIGGLVQIPCIERNAQGAVKAINAARMALAGDGSHHVSLDQAIRTMWETGQDMKAKYKETARGGLAATIRIPVNVVEC